MLIKKNKLKKIYAILFFGAFFLSGIYGVIGADTPENLNSDAENINNDSGLVVPPSGENINKGGQEEGVNYYGEAVEIPAYDRSDFEWNPIEDSETYRNLDLKSDAESGAIATASYNTITGIETTSTPVFLPKEETLPTISEVEPYVGLLAERNNRETIYGSTDGRSLISGQTVFPWNTIVKLYISAADGTYWIGSGAIIDNFHVLTAGHCAFLPDNGGWASSIEVVPAMDNLDTPSDPYGHAFATSMRSYTGWTISESAQHDWAVLTLDRNVGMYTGWMGRTTAGSDSAIYDGTMNIAGYPGDLPVGNEGNRMYFDSDTGRGATANNHWYEADTAGGMSGGPVWRLTGGNRYIMTVHAYGGGDTSSPNYGTRLNTNKYDQIFTWLSADTAPTDKPDMVDRGSGASATSGTITTGDTWFTVSNYVRNVGTAASGSFYVRYYASTNTDISTSDYYLGNHYVSNINAFQETLADWEGTLPESIPDGNYYIGWIIDEANTRAEFDESNNEDYLSTRRTVVGPAPPLPTGYIEVRVKDSVTYADIGGAYVKTTEDATSNVIDIGYTNYTGIVGFYNITDLPIGWFTIYVSKVGYYPTTKSDYINWEGDDDYLTVYLNAMPVDSGYIEVKLRDSDTWNPLPSAYVQTINMSSGFVIDSGYTDSNGFYNITGLTIGWFEVTVDKIAYKPQTRQNYIEWRGDDDYLYFYLDMMPPDSGYIEVRVFNETGGNLTGATVECMNYSSGEVIANGTTNSDGFFNITGLYIGWHIINVTYAEYYEQSRNNYINWYGDDDYQTFFLQALPPDSGFIEVNVFDDTTTLPVSNAIVEVLNQSSGLIIQSGITDSSGFYKVENLTIGWYTVIIDGPGYYNQSQADYIDWVGDSDILTFNIMKRPADSGYIEVNVKDNSTLLPVENAEVSLYYINYTLVKSGNTDSSGFFSITGIYNGLYEVVASHADYGVEYTVVDIQWNGDHENITLLLGPKTTKWIEVLVNDSQSQLPIENAYIRCFDIDSGELVDTGYTDSQGFYNITDLLEGMWRIIASYPGYDESSIDYQIKWKGTDLIRFELDINIPIVDGSVAIFRDLIPWGKNATEPILFEYGISYTVYSSSDMGIVDLSSFQKVIIASDQPQSFYQSIGDNMSWLTSYVADGGILEIHACDNGWQLGDWSSLFLMPGELNKTVFFEWKDVSINMTRHPILLNPYPIEGTELNSWIGGYFTEYGDNTTVILIDPSSQKPVLVESTYGSGFIIASTHALEWNKFENISRILENIVLYNPFTALDWIRVTSQTDSSYLIEPSTYDITWETNGSIADVRIDLYENDTFVRTLTLSTPNDGVYQWTIAIGLIDSDKYQLRISDAKYSETYDFSEYFEIEVRTISITEPTGASSWEVRSIQDINWVTRGIITNVKIDLYLDGTFVMSVTESTPNDGTFPWTLPTGLVEDTQYTIRISDTTESLVHNDSVNFEIFDSRSITVIIPDGATTWSTISSETIAWSSTGIIANVKIDLYIGETFEMEITASTTNDGSFSWNIPVGFTESTQYKIRISDASDLTIYDESTNFEIEDLRSITVNIPADVTSWTFGSTEIIEWSSTGVIANVKIDLYFDGSFQMVIAASTPNNGSLTWEIPDDITSGELYVIRISDASDTSMYSESAEFRIGMPYGVIPGYNQWIFVSVLLGISFILIKKRRKIAT